MLCIQITRFFTASPRLQDQIRRSQAPAPLSTASGSISPAYQHRTPPEGDSAPTLANALYCRMFRFYEVFPPYPAASGRSAGSHPQIPAEGRTEPLRAHIKEQGPVSSASASPHYGRTAYAPAGRNPIHPASVQRSQRPDMPAPVGPMSL